MGTFPEYALFNMAEGILHFQGLFFNEKMIDERIYMAIRYCCFPCQGLENCVICSKQFSVVIVKQKT